MNFLLEQPDQKNITLWMQIKCHLGWEITFFHWNSSGHEFSSRSELTRIIGFYSFPYLSHSQGVHKALREVHSPHRATNWSFSTLLHNLLPVSGKSTEQNLIPYHYLHDIYSTFLQALCREYLTSHINFQASKIIQLKTKEAEERAEKLKCEIREFLTEKEKRQIKTKSNPKGDETVHSSYAGVILSKRPQNKTT